MQKAAKVVGKFGVTGNFIKVATAGRGLRAKRAPLTAPIKTSTLGTTHFAADAPVRAKRQKSEERVW